MKCCCVLSLLGVHKKNHRATLLAAGHDGKILKSLLGMMAFEFLPKRDSFGYHDMSLTLLGYLQSSNFCWINHVELSNIPNTKHTTLSNSCNTQQFFYQQLENSRPRKYMKLLYHSGAQLDIPTPKKIDEHSTYHRPPPHNQTQPKKTYIKNSFTKKITGFTGYTGFDPFLVRPEMPVLPLKKSDPSLGPETSWLQVPRRWPRCNNWWQKPKKMEPKYYLYNLIYVICKLSGAIRNIYIYNIYSIVLYVSIFSKGWIQLSFLKSWVRVA